MFTEVEGLKTVKTQNSFLEFCRTLVIT